MYKIFKNVMSMNLKNGESINKQLNKNTSEFIMFEERTAQKFSCCWKKAVSTRFFQHFESFRNNAFYGLMFAAAENKDFVMQVLFSTFNNFHSNIGLC